VERGYRVALLDLPGDEITAAVAQFDGTSAFPADVSDADAVAEVVDRVEADFGPIDHLFACAGIARVGRTLSVQRSDVDLMMRVNYGGVVNLAYSVLPRMIERGRGEFAAVASLTGIVAPRKMAGYGASKAAVIGFLDSLRYELDGTGVTLTCVCPEAVRTPMAVDFFADPTNRAKAEKSAITPEQVVHACERGLARGRFLVLPGSVSKVSWRVQRFLPRVAHAIQAGDKFDFV
jgi:short-subunit dehydrogenase